MSISFGDVIGESFSWMGKVLFKPFNFKKWIILTFIALLAGYLNFNFSGDFPDFPLKEDIKTNEIFSSFEIHNPLEVSKVALAQSSFEFEQEALSEAECPQLGDFWTTLQMKITESPLATVLVGIVLLLILFIILLFMWLNARFTFIFLEDVAKNDASIKMPWKENRKEGNNYFIFNVILFLCNFAFIGFLIFKGYTALNNIGAFEEAINLGFLKIFFSILPHIIVLFLFIIFMGFLHLIIEDFTLPIMYKEKINILKALGRSLSLLSKNIGHFLLYIMIKIGFGIVAIICAVMLLFVISLILMLIAILLGLIGFLLCKITPSSAQIVLTIVLIVIGIPVALCIGFFMNCVLLPIPVFFRTFSLKFLAGLDEKYDLFKLT